MSVKKPATVRFELRKARLRKSLTQKELSELVGVDYATVSNWENGKSRRLDFDVLARLCSELGVGVGELLQLTGAKRRAGRTNSDDRFATQFFTLYGLTFWHSSDTNPKVNARLDSLQKRARKRGKRLLRRADEALARGDGWTAVAYGVELGELQSRLTLVGRRAARSITTESGPKRKWTPEKVEQVRTITLPLVEKQNAERPASLRKSRDEVLSEAAKAAGLDVTPTYLRTLLRRS